MKVRNGDGKEIPLVQGKEQQWCFAGAAVKRYPHVQGKRNPSKMVGVARGLLSLTFKNSEAKGLMFCLSGTMRFW